MRPEELWDPRLARRYTGPDDPRFREDTLFEQVQLKQAEAAFNPWDGTWHRLCDGLLLHRDTTAREAAQKVAATLQARCRAKEATLIAELMGRDRNSLKQSGATAEEAVQQAFSEQWRQVERLRAEAQEADSVMALVALGDADRLAEVLAAGAPLYPPGYRGAAEDCGVDGSEDDSRSWATLSRSASAASGDGPGAELHPGASGSHEGSYASAGSESGETFPGRAAGARGARTRRGGEGDGSLGGGSEADLDERDGDRTALHLATFLSLPACIEVLVKAAEERGGQEERQRYLDAGDAEGVTALMRAVRSSTEETVKALLAAGASPNKADRMGRAALHRAVSGAVAERELWRLQMLLENAPGLDLNALDDSGTSALHCAVEAGELECMQMLLGAGADVNSKDRYGSTPLLLACSNNDVDAAEMLLTHGADVGAKDEEGRTAAEVAEEQGNDELADMLRRRSMLKRLQTFTASSRGRHGGGAGEAEEVPEGQACCICLSRPKVVILAPCGHRCACKRCMRMVMEGQRDKRKCPVCQEQIESFITKVYD